MYKIPSQTMNMYERIQAMKEKPETTRAGEKWSLAEDEQIMHAIKGGMGINDIAKKHQRTYSSIKARLIHNASLLIDKGSMSLCEAAKMIHVSEDELAYSISQKKAKAVKKLPKKDQNSATQPEVSLKDILAVMVEIRDFMKIIAEKQ